MKTISFVDLWDGFSPKDYFLPYLFPDYTLVSPDGSPDILVYSIFGNYHRDCVAGKKIHFSGENTDPRPEADLNLTFRLDNSATKNIRLPLWLLYLHHDINNLATLRTQSNPDTLFALNLLIHPSPLMSSRKTIGCGFVCSNPAPDSPRPYLFHKFKPASAGKAYNNIGGHIPDIDGVWEKFCFITQYSNNLCPENSIGEGYTTEKLLHAFAAGCIPIYWGWLPDDLSTHDFNLEKCIILLDADEEDFRIGSEIFASTPAINLDKYHAQLCPDAMRKKIKEYL